MTIDVKVNCKAHSFQSDFFSEEYQYSSILKWAKRYLEIKLPLNARLEIRVTILVNFSDLLNLPIGSGFMHTLYHLWQTWTDRSQHWHSLLFAWGSFLRLLFPTNKEEIPAENDSEQQPNCTCSDSSAGGVHLSQVTPNGIHQPPQSKVSLCGSYPLTFLMSSILLGS